MFREKIKRERGYGGRPRAARPTLIGALSVDQEIEAEDRRRAMLPKLRPEELPYDPFSVRADAVTAQQQRDRNYLRRYPMCECCEAGFLAAGVIHIAKAKSVSLCVGCLRRARATRCYNGSALLLSSPADEEDLEH